MPHPSPAPLPGAFIDKLSWVGRIPTRVTLSTISSNHLGSRSALQMTVKSCIIWKERREMKTDSDEHGLLLALWSSYGALHCNGMGRDQWQNNPDMLLRQNPGSLFLLGASSLSTQALLCSLHRTLAEAFLLGSSYCPFKHVMLFHR